MPFLVIDRGQHILIDTGAADAWLPTMGLLLRVGGPDHQADGECRVGAARLLWGGPAPILARLEFHTRGFQGSGTALAGVIPITLKQVADGLIWLRA
jgi:hypothetical protein